MKASALPLIFALGPFLTLALEADLPGELLISTNAAVPPTLLKPLVFNSPEGHHGAEEKRSVIDGLLNIVPRQGCPSGYGECSNPAGRCCPIGGRCCQGSGCCKAGYWCYADGCCKTSENGCEGNSCCPKSYECCKGGGCCAPGDYCTVVDGIRGCCEIGQTCSSSGSGGCTTPGYSECSGEDFCCPTGYTCYRDSSNLPRCRAPGSTGGSTTSRSTTATPTTTFSTTASTSGSATSTATFAVVTTYTSLPPPPSGFQNVDVDLNDAKFDWSAGWTFVTASCNSTAKAKRCDSNTDDFQRFYYDFTGVAVYVNLASSNANYAIYMDYQKVTEYNGIGSDDNIPKNCTFSWASLQLSATQTHTLSIYVYGAAFSGTLSGRALGDPWWLEMNNLVVQKSLGPSTATPSATTTTTTTGGGSGGLDGGSGDGALGLSVGFSFLVALLSANLLFLLA